MRRERSPAVRAQRPFDRLGVEGGGEPGPGEVATVDQEQPAEGASRERSATAGVELVEESTRRRPRRLART